MKTTAFAAAFAATLSLAPSLAQAQARVSDDVIRIGVLGDMSGPFSDYSGAGSVAAVRMAIEDAGGKVLGRTVEVISADHQNKADVAATIARDWFDTRGVDVIVSLSNSAAALAAVRVAEQKNRIALVTGAASSALTNDGCTPNSIHWTIDTNAMSNGLAAGILDQGGKTWFMVTLDFAFGLNLERNVAAMITAKGGTLRGSARHPANTSDFSSYMLQAQTSGAQIVGLATAGADLVNAVKSAHEFGLTRNDRQRLAALSVLITDVHGLGLDVAKGMQLTEAFYWDLNDDTRKFSRRYFDTVKKMPTQMQAGDYSAISHYLKAVSTAGTDEAGPVMAAMKAAPVKDVFTSSGQIREDGLLVKDMYLFEVKTPVESKAPWDYYKLVRTIPADQAYAPLSASTCKLVKK